MPADLKYSLTPGACLFTTAFDASKLKAFSMAELRDVREGATLAADVILGAMEQPRFSQSGTNILNSAGDALDLLREAALAIADAAEDEAQARSDATGADAQMRALLLLNARAARGDTSNPEGADDFLHLASIAAGEAA